MQEEQNIFDTKPDRHAEFFGKNALSVIKDMDKNFQDLKFFVNLNFNSKDLMDFN